MATRTDFSAEEREVLQWAATDSVAVLAEEAPGDLWSLKAFTLGIADAAAIPPYAYPLGFVFREIAE